jgi:hypothetical protein
MIEDIKAVGELGEVKQKPKISKESAQKIFKGILDYYDIDFEDIVNERGKEGAKTVQNKFVRAIMKGKIETNHSDDHEKGFQIIQNLSSGTTVAYNEYNAKAAEESDKATGVSSQQYMLLGALCGKGVDYIKNKKVFNGPDTRLAEHIALLFFL